MFKPTPNYKKRSRVTMIVIGILAGLFASIALVFVLIRWLRRLFVKPELIPLVEIEIPMEPEVVEAPSAEVAEAPPVEAPPPPPVEAPPDVSFGLPVEEEVVFAVPVVVAPPDVYATVPPVR